MKHVCVIGSSVADVIVQVPALPKRAQDINAVKQTMRLGGCAYNIAHMLQLYQIPFTLFSPIGQGPYGDFVAKELQEQAISLSIPRVKEENGCCYCMVEPDGERSFISVHGAEYRFKKEWFSLLEEQKYDTVYVCGIELEETHGDVIIKYLEEHPHPTLYFAPGPRFLNISQDRLQRMFALSPILHLNEREALTLTSTSSYQNAAEDLSKLCNNTIIITLGDQGTYIKEKSACFKLDACQTQVIDTIGAGDAHLGAIIAERKLHHTWKDSILHANQVAAAVVSNHGSSIDEQIFKTIHFE